MGKPWKKWLAAILPFFVLGIMGMTGCVAGLPETLQISVEIDGKELASKQAAKELGEEIEMIDRILSDESVELPEEMVAKLGEHGYVAVDVHNQVDMEGADQVLEFCKIVDSQEKGELLITVITSRDDFITYCLETKDGEVLVTRQFHQMDGGGRFQGENMASYSASEWRFTEEGYLLFEGTYFSEVDFAFTLSDGTEHTALRVFPLEKRCRELNQKYILPVGYGHNNLFLTCWNEDDYGELDFYDIFDVFYPCLYEEPTPYMVLEETGMAGIYGIPEDLFEQVIMTYFSMDKEILRSRTTYLPERAVYEYRPRGIFEVEGSEIPYPEVVDYTENQDGTITLIVNGVYPFENTSRSYSHKTVVRPLAEGGFQYVSNTVIPPKEGFNLWWHSDRLSKEEWEKAYGGQEEVFE